MGAVRGGPGPGGGPGRDVTAADDGGAWRCLRLEPPSDVGRQIRFVRRFPAYVKAWDGEALWLSYTGEDGLPQRLGLRPHGDGAVRVHGEMERARRMLCADLDLSPLEACVGALAEDSPIRMLHERYHGFRPVLFADVFEGLCWAVLAQQVSVVAACAVKDRTAAAAAGDRDPHQPLAFPSPERLASLGAGRLRALGMSGRKAQTLLHFAHLALGDEGGLDALALGTTGEVFERLRSIAGIGPWSAAYALIRVFGRTDIGPWADIGLRRAWGRAASLGRMASAAEVEEAAASLPGWQAFLAWYLWLDERDREEGPVAPP